MSSQADARLKELIPKLNALDDGLYAARIAAPWSKQEAVEVASALGRTLPASFVAFTTEFGRLVAIDAGTRGVRFHAPGLVVSEYGNEDYGEQLQTVGGTSCFPFAADPGGNTFVLAFDDSAVFLVEQGWTDPRPKRIAGSFDGFLHWVADGMESMLE